MDKELFEVLNFARDRVETQKLFKANYSRELAPDFNVLDFMGLNENKISELFAFLINPLETHSHDDTFLNEFLEHFNIQLGHLDSRDVNVSLEYPTDSRKRMDILINKGHFEKAVGIENKIYLETADQAGQLADYIKFLEKNTKGNFILFYLVPKGKIPLNHSISKEEREKYEGLGKFKIINYEDDIIPLIRKFRDKSENDRLRSFIKDFENKLTNWYIGDNMNNSEQIKNYILENGRIEASFSIISALNVLKSELKNKFINQLNELASKKGLRKIKDLSYIPTESWMNHTIDFSFEGRALIYGVKRIKEDPQKGKIEELERLFYGKESFNTSVWWPAYTDFYSEIDTSPKFWVDINSGIAISRAEEFFEIILNAKDKLPQL